MNQLKFERIDKGIKRPRMTKPDQPLSITNRGALANLDDEQVIDRIASGAYVSHLATEHGVSGVALHLRLKSHPRYKDALRSRNAAKLDQHQDGIERAADPLSLACAREGWKAATWRAERECPEEWGQKQEVTHRAPDGPILSIVLAPPVAQTPNGAVLTPIEGDCEKE